jgi:hypothetical protein
VIVEEFATTTPVAATPPSETVAPAAKPEPEIVTAVPPADEPEDGLMAPIVGAGAIAG